VLFRSLYLMLPAVLGCQGKADKPAPVQPTMIEVHEGTQVVASVRTGRPCRATIGPIELIVGGPPIISQSGDTKWSGETTAQAGTFYSHNDDRVARVFPVSDPQTGGVYDVNGVALIRIATSTAGDTATVTSSSSALLRTLAKHGESIVVDSPKLTVTGTSDLVLAALLSAPEIVPEVRMLASCERVLVAMQKGS